MQSSLESPPIIILGNKRDLESEVQVTSEEIEEFV
jgi:hypothetical protein